MLITGSSGRIGKVCSERFGNLFQIVGCDRKPKGEEQDIDHILMDVSSDESVKNALSQIKKKYGTTIDTVIHLAAYYSFSESKPELYDEITVQGTRRLLENLQQFDVGQFIFSSTLLVHAPCAVGEKISETSPIDPTWDYPKSKVETEKVIHEKRGKIPTLILRIAGCYDDLCHSIPIAHNVQRIYEHQLEAHLFPGDKKHGNPFLHLEDLADAIELAIQKREKLPKELILLIGEDQTASYAELQNRISEILDHRDFRVFRIPKWVAKEGAWVEEHLPFISDDFIQPWMIDIADDHYALDITLARKMLGWKPKHYVLDHLPIMLELLKTDPIEWYNTNLLKVPHWLLKSVREIEEKKAYAPQESQ